MPSRHRRKDGFVGQEDDDEEEDVQVVGVGFSGAHICLFVFLLIAVVGGWVAAGFAIANNGILHSEFDPQPAPIDNSSGGVSAVQGMSTDDVGTLVESSGRGVFATPSLNPEGFPVPEPCVNLTKCSFGTCVCEQHIVVVKIPAALKNQMCGFFGDVCPVREV